MGPPGTMPATLHETKRPSAAYVQVTEFEYQPPPEVCP
jgi:hypothetical protein